MTRIGRVSRWLVVSAAGVLVACATAAAPAPAGRRTVWIDVEGTKYWSHDKAYNQRFFTDMVNRVRSRLSRHVGVYTSKSQWGPIMGDWNGGADLPLWYAHYDNKPDFNDFSAF